MYSTYVLSMTMDFFTYLKVDRQPFNYYGQIKILASRPSSLQFISRLLEVPSVLMECVYWHTVDGYWQCARQTRCVKDCQQIVPQLIWHHLRGLWTQCTVSFIILCKCQNTVQSNDNNDHGRFNVIQNSVIWERAHHCVCLCICVCVWGPIHVESLLPLGSSRTSPHSIKMLLQSL